MNNSLYIAASAMRANQQQVDVISNNLANTNTTGYKKDLALTEAFPEVLLSKINDNIDMDNHQPFTGIDVEQDENIFSLSTESGYFKVRTPAGDGYSRSLQFTVDENGYLKTFYKTIDDEIKTDGENFVIGKNGPIKVDGEDIEIDAKGNVISNGQTVDNLLTFTPFNVIGTTSGGVRFDKISTDFTEGTMVETGNNLDFALKGDGFFKVVNENGDILYTRDGSFTINNTGELVTNDGYFVLGEFGSIVLEDDSFTIAGNGDIIKEGQVIDSLDIVHIGNKEYLRKQGNNLYRMLENVEPLEEEFDGQVLNGYIESTNVDTIKEMVNMITALRSYEASKKMINAQDELLGKVVNELGRV